MKKTFKKITLLLLRIVVSLCLIYFIISRVGWNMIRENIRMLDMSIFIVVLFMYGISILIMSLRWKLFIPAKINIKSIFNMTYVGAFFNICLPGSVGGDIIRTYYLSRVLKHDPVRGIAESAMTADKTCVSTAGHNVTAFGSVLIDRYIGLITLLVIGITATFLGSKYFSNNPIRWFVPALLGIILVVSIVLLKLRIGATFPVISELYTYTDEMKFRKKEITTAFLYSIVAQMIVICSVFVLSRGLSMEVPFMSVLSFIPVISVISLIPVTISGIGLREGAFVVLFGLIGILPEKAMTLSIVWFLSIVVGSLPGLIAYLLYYRAPSEAI